MVCSSVGSPAVVLAQPADEPGAAAPVEAAATVAADGDASGQPTTYDSREVATDALEEARLLFLAGRRAFDGGRFEDALDSFRRALALTHDPHLLYDIAVALDRLRRDEEALAAFGEYLEREPESPDRPDVEARMRILRDHLAHSGHGAASAENGGSDARAAPLSQPAVPDGAGHDESAGPRFWVWALVTLAVVGAGAAAIAAAVLSSRADPIAGDEGVVLYGLSW